MYMVFIGIHCLDEERRIFLARGIQICLECCFDIGLEPPPSVLCAPDDVVLEFVCAVIQRSRTHGTSLRFAPGFHSSPGAGVDISTVYLSVTASARGFLEY